MWLPYPRPRHPSQRVGKITSTKARRLNKVGLLFIWCHVYIQSARKCEHITRAAHFHARDPAQCCGSGLNVIGVLHSSLCPSCSIIVKLTFLLTATDVNTPCYVNFLGSSYDSARSGDIFESVSRKSPNSFQPSGASKSYEADGYGERIFYAI